MAFEGEQDMPYAEGPEYQEWATAMVRDMGALVTISFRTGEEIGIMAAATQSKIAGQGLSIDGVGRMLQWAATDLDHPTTLAYTAMWEKASGYTLHFRGIAAARGGALMCQLHQGTHIAHNWTLGWIHCPELAGDPTGPGGLRKPSNGSRTWWLCREDVAMAGPAPAPAVWATVRRDGHPGYVPPARTTNAVRPATTAAATATSTGITAATHSARGLRVTKNCPSEVR